MHILLPGAWPEPEVAADLAPHLEARAPALVQCLRSVRPAPRSVACPPADTWCTAEEHWLLQATGYTPDGHISAGLGPLRLPAEAGVPGSEPIWLAELIHMAPSRDGAALLPARTLHITPDQAQALLESARAELQDHPMLDLQPTALASTWRVSWSEPVAIDCASPALVAASAVNDWWPQSPQARPWRRLVNALQMAWFEHPVNLARTRQGEPPINSLWLYGGGRRDQLRRPLPPDLHIDDRLGDFAMRQDWGGWLQALADMDKTLFGVPGQVPDHLTLCGRERHITLNIRPGWFSRLRPHNWSLWWSSR
ncbi:hypothetical protein [Castellaniella sp.]|uniref:hypothetical protein n=1 Tax=Castellaniella sp. TaxID=1955812 RepID=UPI0035602EC1